MDERTDTTLVRERVLERGRRTDLCGAPEWYRGCMGRASDGPAGHAEDIEDVAEPGELGCSVLCGRLPRWSSSCMVRVTSIFGGDGELTQDEQCIE